MCKIAHGTNGSTKQLKVLIVLIEIFKFKFLLNLRFSPSTHYTIVSYLDCKNTCYSPFVLLNNSYSRIFLPTLSNIMYTHL